MKKTNKKGFTLVELVIVIAVIAILAGVLIGTFATVISRANQSKALQELKSDLTEVEVAFSLGGIELPKAYFVKNGFTFLYEGGSLSTVDAVPDDYVSTITPFKDVQMWTESAYIRKTSEGLRNKGNTKEAWAPRDYAPDDFGIATPKNENVQSVSVVIKDADGKTVYKDGGTINATVNTGIAFQAESVVTLKAGQYYTYSLTYTFSGTTPDQVYTGLICLTTDQTFTTT